VFEALKSIVDSCHFHFVENEMAQGFRVLPEGLAADATAEAKAKRNLPLNATEDEKLARLDLSIKFNAGRAFGYNAENIGLRGVANELHKMSDDHRHALWLITSGLKDHFGHISAALHEVTNPQPPSELVDLTPLLTKATVFRATVTASLNTFATSTMADEKKTVDSMRLLDRFNDEQIVFPDNYQTLQVCFRGREDYCDLITNVCNAFLDTSEANHLLRRFFDRHEERLAQLISTLQLEAKQLASCDEAKLSPTFIDLARRWAFRDAANQRGRLHYAIDAHRRQVPSLTMNAIKAYFTQGEGASTFHAGAVRGGIDGGGCKSRMETHIRDQMCGAPAHGQRAIRSAIERLVVHLRTLSTEVDASSTTLLATIGVMDPRPVVAPLEPPKLLGADANKLLTVHILRALPLPNANSRSSVCQLGFETAVRCHRPLR
jgi:hypothetical protein